MDLMLAARAVLSWARRRWMIVGTAVIVLLATAVNLFLPIAPASPPRFEPDHVTLDGVDYELFSGPMCARGEGLDPVVVSVSKTDVRVMGVDGRGKAPRLETLVPCSLAASTPDSRLRHVDGGDLTLMDDWAYPSGTLVPVTLLSIVVSPSGVTGAWVCDREEGRGASGLVPQLSTLKP